MPLDADQTAELKQLIGVSRKRALNFGICLGSTPESTVLVLHRQRSSDVLMREAKKAGDAQVVIWGSGKPMREFLHVDDMAAASLFVMDLDRATYDAETQPMLSHINVGTGQDVTIRKLAETVTDVVGFKGQIVFDASKPDGTPRKLLNVDRLRALGWQSETSLSDGISKAYADFLTKAVA